AASVTSGTYNFTITASNGVNPDATQNFTLTVTDESTTVLVTGVTLNKSYISIHRGSGEQLTATVLPTTATDKSVTWSSDNLYVATVDANGLVTAIGPGSAIITARTVDGGFEATCYVAVTTPATSVTISPSVVSLDVGEIYFLMVTVEPFNVSNSNVAWSSDNEAVATVTQGGLIRAVGGGTATITATTADGSGVAGTCTVYVDSLMTEATMDVTTALAELLAEISTDIGIVLTEPIIFIPADSSDISSQIDMLSAMMPNIKPEDLHVNEHGVITIQDWIAKDIAEKLPGVDHAEVITLPVFEAVLNNAGEIAAVSFKVKGSSLMFDGIVSIPENVRLLMILSSDSGDWFNYTSTISGLNDKTFTILDMSNKVFTGDLESGEDYKLLFLIKDGGSYDLDGQADRSVWGILALIGVPVK
ncbi:MAG: Ig-like domain-containing protein, partial [Synergistaceae bacterium]|nr:Ig-like domain-containing protein [Synergistaceae bacterium]